MPVPGSSRAGGRAQPIIAYETDLDEAIGVATALRRARSPGAPWSSLAVLARTNAQLVLFERELEAAGVPFRSGGGRAFLGRPAVRRALDRLTSPSDSPGLHGWLEELATSGTGQATDVSNDECELFGEPSSGNDLADTALLDVDLAELGALAADYLRYDSSASTAGFVSWLEASLRADPPDRSATPSTS